MCLSVPAVGVTNVSDAIRLPPDSELARMAVDGMSHAEVQAECERFAGRPLARATVSAALSRAALNSATGHRYFDCLPWHLRPEHASAYPARMLRLLGRLRTGFPLHEGDQARLDSWLAALERERVSRAGHGNALGATEHGHHAGLFPFPDAGK